MEPIKQRASQHGYLLFEVMIAVAIFAIVALSLGRSMHGTIEATNYLDRQLAVRYGLESILREARQRPKRREMALNHEDEALDIRYHTELVETRFVTVEGEPVSHLYLLRATARFVENGEERVETAEVYVHRPS